MSSGHAPGKRRNSANTKERILRAAIALFSEHGPAATTVGMLARRAHVNRRMLYYYFGNKEGLYRAAIQRTYEQSAVIEAELLQGNPSAEELLNRFISAYYEFLSKHPEFVRMLAWENLRQGRSVRHVDTGSLKAPVLEAFRTALERGKADGSFRADVDEKQLFLSCIALSFFDFSNRHTVSQALGFDVTSPKAIKLRVKHVVGLVLDGIRAHGNGNPERTKRGKK